MSLQIQWKIQFGLGASNFACTVGLKCKINVYTSAWPLKCLLLTCMFFFVVHLLLSFPPLFPTPYHCSFSILKAHSLTMATNMEGERNWFRVEFVFSFIWTKIRNDYWTASHFGNQQHWWLKGQGSLNLTRHIIEMQYRLYLGVDQILIKKKKLKPLIRIAWQSFHIDCNVSNMINVTSVINK